MKKKIQRENIDDIVGRYFEISMVALRQLAMTMEAGQDVRDCLNEWTGNI